MITIQLLFSGRSYPHSDQLPRALELTDDATVDDALREVAQFFPDEHPLPESCLVACCGAHLGTVAAHRNAPLRDGDELLLIAPVAGG